MIVLIGGLLVSALLSSPAAEPLDIHTDSYYITYESQLQDENVLSGIKENTQLMKIDELISVINDQNRCMKHLLKEKTKVIDKIQTQLDFRAYTKTPFNEYQMDSFTLFTGFYNQEASALQCALKKININKDLMSVKKELLHKEANYSAVIDELSMFSNNLGDAIVYLKGIIEEGNRTLQIL